MRHSNRKIFITALAVPRNLGIIVTVVIINLVIIVLGRLYIDPFLSRRPCVVCGRPDTQPIKTLWQYEVKVIPYCKEVNLWYCDRHIRNAPDLVKEIPSAKDTVKKRYVQAVIGSLLLMITLFYALVLMRFELVYFFSSTLVIGAAFLFGKITSSLSLTILFGAIVALPGLFFYVWNKREKI